ncbi:MAG: virulence RhuM family protein [Calditrichaeota bacterium]|nr:virulence RhuM family protein [Calditrichota bacterium]
MSQQNTPQEPRSEIVLYETPDGSSRLEVRLEDETVWLSQNQLADLYQTSKQNVSLHINNIYEEGELNAKATVKEYLTVQNEGGRSVSRRITYYNLDMIIAVGYRVKSPIATRFRQWATARLSEYIVKGFTMDDERLKGQRGFADYFDELLERIRDIRASEARVYQKIRDIFALAADYHPDDEATQKFFAKMQNKMIYAATGQTAAELIRTRANADQPNMGLTNWKGKVVRKQDIMIAKNYLSAHEIDTLNRITVMFLDQAEFRAQRRQNIHEVDWELALGQFLSQNDLPVLDSAGSVSRESAEEWSHGQYSEFEERRQREKDAEDEARYIEDLKNTAKSLEVGRKEAKPETKKKAPKRKGKGA